MISTLAETAASCDRTEISTLLIQAAVLAVETDGERIDDIILKMVRYQSPSERRKVFERELG